MKRVLVKTITYRILGSTVTAIVAYAVTHQVRYMLAIGFGDVAAKAVGYFCHEMIWQRVSWGRKAVPTQEGVCSLYPPDVRTSSTTRMYDASSL